MRRIQFEDAIVWRYPEAPLDLARALGEIAADLWLAGKVALTPTYSVATIAADAEGTQLG
jgi:hypothetical protein